ncbi:unnamed protein product [Fraxinus pennsylvanica]|uniref:VOC domain-containing protein n=1 Tax=Fraxinus pennsylvanica TaxID=56036 RepID=A0AAD1ZF35_9LAMI|nr:unnamed protein product [Fraxinus pennsylvanica]
MDVLKNPRSSAPTMEEQEVVVGLVEDWEVELAVDWEEELGVDLVEEQEQDVVVDLVGAAMDRKADHEIPLVLSVELKIGSATIVVPDIIDNSFAKVKSVVTRGVICLETEDVEAALAQAMNAGATTEGEISEGDDSCCGGRVGKVKDPYGNIWLICSSRRNALVWKLNDPLI